MAAEIASSLGARWVAELPGSDRPLAVIPAAP